LIFTVYSFIYTIDSTIQQNTVSMSITGQGLASHAPRVKSGILN
jgi:hypothetical protein